MRGAIWRSRERAPQKNGVHAVGPKRFARAATSLVRVLKPGTLANAKKILACARIASISTKRRTPMSCNANPAKNRSFRPKHNNHTAIPDFVIGATQARFFDTARAEAGTTKVRTKSAQALMKRTRSLIQSLYHHVETYIGQHFLAFGAGDASPL